MQVTTGVRLPRDETSPGSTWTSVQTRSDDEVLRNRRSCCHRAALDFSTCQRTARDSTTFSRSRPLRIRSSTVSRCDTAHHILLDDGPIVEHLGDVVAGRANQLHAALECLMVRPSADERRQERVVNIDDPLRIAVDEVVRQNLHVAREHHEIRLVLVDQRLNLASAWLCCLWRPERSRKECCRSRQLPDCRDDWR